VKTWKLTRVWIWYQSRKDAKKDLPSVRSRALGEAERQIQTAAAVSLTREHEKYNQTVNPLAAKQKTAIREHDLVNEDFVKLASKVGRQEIRAEISHAAHTLGVIALSLGEGAFNLSAFNVLREPGWKTILMALCVIVGIPFSAFAIGKWAKQWPAPKLSTAIVRMLIVVAFTVGGLITINRIRIAYLQDGVLSQHPWLAWAFLPLNFFILGVCALLAYLASDPEPGFAEARRKVDRIAAKVHSIESKMRRLVSGFNSKTAALSQAAIQGVFYYRMLNRRARSGQPPRYFDDPTDPNHLPPLPVYQTAKHALEGLPADDHPGAERKPALLPTQADQSDSSAKRKHRTSATTVEKRREGSSR